MTNACDPQDVAKRRLHLQALHGYLLRVALKVKKRVPYEELLCANQKSVKVRSNQAMSVLVWKCDLNWQSHPLTAFRLECQKCSRPTRHSVRQFPPQTLAQCVTLLAGTSRKRYAMSIKYAIFSFGTI